MLEKFQLVNKDQAYAIVSKFPTFYSLMNTYKSLNKEDGKLVLAEIQVKIIFLLILNHHLCYLIFSGA